MIFQGKGHAFRQLEVYITVCFINFPLVLLALMSDR